MSNPYSLLGPALTADYEPPYQSFVNYIYDPNRPLFNAMAIDAMLYDPRVTLGLAIIRGPILTHSRFFVHCDNPEQKDFLAKQINRFWRNSADLALEAMPYGYQPAEVIYRSIDSQLQFDKLKYIHPRDAKVRTLKGAFCGIDVAGTSLNNRESLFIGVPKSFWHVHRRRKHRWYGQSRLYGAFPPWYEKWARRGFRDQRQLWFYKNSFRGPIIKYPVGTLPPPTGSPVGTMGRDHRQIAQEMGDKFASGATVTLPATPPTNPQWEFLDPAAQAAPDGLLSYGHDLDDEILEGMEIHPEIVRATRGGGEGLTIGGAGGRDISQEAFYAILSEICLGLMTDLDEQILTPLSRIRFGDEANYEIECFGLLRGQNQNESPSPAQNSSGEETVNMGENPTNQVQMTDSLGEFAPSGYNKTEEKQLVRHYRKVSDYQFKLGRVA